MRYSYKVYFVYLIKCKDGSLYTGITTDVERRFKEHRSGKGAHYTKMKGVLKVVYSETQPDRSTATKREAQIKRWPRVRKLRLTHQSR